MSGWSLLACDDFDSLRKVKLFELAVLLAVDVNANLTVVFMILDRALSLLEIDVQHVALWVIGQLAIFDDH